MSDHPQLSGPRWAFELVVRSLVFLAIWWGSTDGDRYLLWFGAAAAVVAAFVSIKLAPASRLRLRGLIAYAPFFLRQSVLGGIDVARRAIDPRMPIDPAFVDVDLRLRSESARVLVADTLSLLPGTVSVEIRPDSLRLHVIDRSMPIDVTLDRLERHVARIVGEPLRGERPVTATEEGSR